MSLTHGHFYAAEKVREKLGGDLRDVIDNNITAFHLGSIGHDLIYWAGTYSWKKNRENTGGGPYFFLPSDPHQDRTGEMIRNLLEDYVVRRNALCRGLPEREQEALSNERKTNEKLAAILEKEAKATEEDVKNAIASEKKNLDEEIKAIESEKQAIKKERALLENLTSAEAGKKGDIEKELDALLAERKKPVDRYLAFILGWITHWATDMYVHSLVDLYGGRYSEVDISPENSRHLQLELIETRYVLEKMPSLATAIIPMSNKDIWTCIARPLSRTYEKAVIADSGKQKNTPEERPYTFAEIMPGTVNIMVMAKTCAEDCCSNSEGKATTLINQQVEKNWTEASDAHFPTQQMYDKLTGWNKPGPERPAIITVERDSSWPATLAYIVNVADTGLYGKFLKDYDPFMDAAVEKATQTINAAAAAIDGAGIGPLPGGLPHIPQISDIDILLPENTPEVRNSAAMKGIDDGTIRDIFGMPVSRRNSLYYDIEYQLRSACHEYYDRIEYDDGKKIRLPGRFVEVTADKDSTNRLYMSRTGTVRLSLDVPNPEKYHCRFLLRMSLTGETAFKAPLYREIDFRERGDEGPGRIHYLLFDKSGGKIMEWDEINGLREGRLTTFFQSGAIETEENYAAGKRDGKCIRYFEDTKIVAEEGNYKEDLKEGLWISYFEDGNKKYEEQYLNDNKNGKSIAYFETGEISAAEEYLNGQKTGKSIAYFKTGRISSETEYLNDLRHGHWICYHENGNKSQEGDEFNGSPTGHWINYFESGAKSSEGDTGSGYTDYYEDGHVSGQMSANGHWTAWYNNRNKKEEGDYRDDDFNHDRTGHWTSYFEDGIKASEGAYEKDRPVGRWIYWWPNGNRKMEGDFAEGSEWKYWDKAGNPVKKEDFRNW